jgi:drug/metabolite transporter (DMT)-like permease
MALSFAGICYENMISYICIGALPILNIVIFIGITPLFTILLAVPILGEKFNYWNVL